MFRRITRWIQSIFDTFHSHHLLIFFVPFLIYMSNGREISSGDPVPTVFVAVNFVKHGTVFLDDLQEYIPYHNLPYYVSEQKGRIVSNYPVFPGIMASPIFAPFVWMGMLEKGDGDLVWRYLAKLCGAIFTSLSVYFMYLTLRRLIAKNGALVLAYAYGLGTALWPIASQSLWQHGPSVLWWTLALYFIVLLQQSDKRTQQNRCLILSGIATGCALLCRTVNGVGVAWLCLIFLIRYKKQSIYFITPAILLTVLLLSYNIILFDSWKGGDVVLHSLHWELDRVKEDSWSTPLWVGLPGQLISPSRGIFIFSPFLIFSFLGIVLIWKKKEPCWRILAWTIPIPIVMLLLFSKYSVWWGGNSHYGPRYQIETYPFLMMYLSVTCPFIRQSRFITSVFITMLIYAFSVQFIGAFCYPSSWATKPTLIWQDKDRYWDYYYNQIVTCAQSGIKWPFTH